MRHRQHDARHKQMEDIPTQMQAVRQVRTLFLLAEKARPEAAKHQCDPPTGGPRDGLQDRRGGWRRSSGLRQHGPDG